MKHYEQKKSNQQKIQQAAQTLMVQQGIRKTTMQAVSDLAGISLVTIYKHFPSKQVLAEAVVLSFYQEHMTNTIQQIEDPNLSIPAKLAALTQRHDLIRQQLSPAVFQEFFEMGQNQQIGPAIHVLHNRMLQDFIQVARTAGIIRTSASDANILLLFNSLLAYLEANPPADHNALGPEMETLLLYGLRGPSAK
ncbi:TetR/AcrR family transcriptional regulator [Leuconostocaceae bacterium ESL0958]|nr:TetR/AcrR family transcriptional regulator [Leuconostocaceae bacterium ESL0958]